MIICENDCDNIVTGALWQAPPAVDSTRLSEPDTEIYTRGGRAEPSAAQEQKDLKFTWDINVNEHSRLSESYDLCKVYAGSMSLLRGTFKDSEVNRPVSSLKGAPSRSPEWTRRCHDC